MVFFQILIAVFTANLLIGQVVLAPVIPNDSFGYEPLTVEHNCFQYFNDTASGVETTNAFLLSKMVELMYLERLDYQMQYLSNDRKPVDDIPSSKWMKKNCRINEENFEMLYAKRFAHYFGGKTILYGNGVRKDWHPKDDEVVFRYIHKVYTAPARFLGYQYEQGLDPELMVISTKDLILILFRGTDDVGSNEWAEWTGTDFRIHQMNSGGALVGTKIHTGFWLSFDFIRDELIKTLTVLDADQKKIWVAGHSLGGALSVVTGTYLKAAGLDVQNVYSYAGPRTIGNKAFIKKANQLLPNRIQRFEYYQDPVTLLWAPGFGYEHVGQRTWYDEAEKGNYKMYTNTHERVLFSGGLKRYPNIVHEDIKEARRIKRNQMNGITFITPSMLHYHNPQWYVKAAYQQLNEEEKARLPLVDDSYPYLYFFLEGTK